MSTKKFTISEGSGITLAYNEIKDIMKVMRSLENGGIYWKNLLEKSLAKKGDLLKKCTYAIS